MSLRIFAMRRHGCSGAMSTTMPTRRDQVWLPEWWAKSLSEGGNRPGLKVGRKGMDGGTEGGKGRRKEGRE